MSIPNFLSKLTNPFDDLSNIKKLVEAYSEGNYYSSVVHTVDSDKIMGVNNIKDMDEFYVTAYNKWRDNVVNMTEEQFEELKAANLLKNDFIRVRRFIKMSPRPKTREEVLNILYGKKDSDLMDALDHYNPFEQVETSWTYLASRFYDNRMSPRYSVSHRLYLNIDSDAIHKVVTELFNKCNELGLLYEFKFSESANRGDSLVIYCSNDNLLVFVKLLELIRKEHPELEGKFHTPPIFSGVYDGWIGYGEEYSKAKSSYTKDRCDIISERLNGHFNNWRSSASDIHVSLDGESVDIIDYIVHELCEDSFRYQKGQYEYRKNNNSNRSKGDIRLLDSKKYREQVYNSVKTFILNNKDKIFSHEALSNDYCEITNIFGEKSRITIRQVYYILRKVFVNSVKNNTKVLEFFREDFKQELKKHELSERVVISNESLSNILNYQADRLKGHRVVAARKADNKKLYKTILELFDEMAEIISNRVEGEVIDPILDKYMNKYFALKNALDTVKYYGFSGSSIDEDERAQYYIYRMYKALDRCNVKEYEYFRNLTLAYDELLKSGKNI